MQFKQVPSEEMAVIRELNGSARRLSLAVFCSFKQLINKQVGLKSQLIEQLDGKIESM